MRKVRLPRWNFRAKSRRSEHEVVESTSGESRPRDPSRAKFLRSAAASLTGTVAGAVAVGLAGSSVAEANCGDNAVLCHSGNTFNPNQSANATEVQLTGLGNPGVVFLAQADNKYAPSAANFPAALAGWTSDNPNIPHGVYGYTERPNGDGVAGVSVGAGGEGVFGQSFSRNGVHGVSFSANDSGVWGENNVGGYGVSGSANAAGVVAGVWGGNAGAGPGVRASAFGTGVQLHLDPVSTSVPPPTGQGGDLFVTVDGAGVCGLWFHRGMNGWVQIA